MPAPSTNTLVWALRELQTWHSKLGEIAFRKRLATLMTLRRLGATTSASAEFDGNGITNVVRDLFGISDSKDELLLTRGRHFLNPFSGEYMKQTWPTGTMYTRLGTGSYDDWAIVSNTGTRMKCRLRADYLNGVAHRLQGARIPGVPLAVFILRRPSALGIKEDSLTNPGDYIQALRKTFGFDQAEADRVFDPSVNGFPS